MVVDEAVVLLMLGALDGLAVMTGSGVGECVVGA